MRVLLYTIEADFHKAGVCGSGQVWAIAWDVLRRKLSRGGSGRRADVDFVVRFRCGGIYFVFFVFILFSFERTRPAASMRLPRLISLFTCIEAIFWLEGKASSYRGACRVPLVYYSVCPCV